MTITKELIETLKAASNYVDTLGGNSIRYRQVIAKAESAVSEPEPLAHDNCRNEYQCRTWCGNSSCASHWDTRHTAAVSEPVAIPDEVRKYAKSMQKNGYQGPIMWASKVIDFVADYTTPPAEAKPLTDAQIEDMITDWYDTGESVAVFARTVEAAIANQQDPLKLKIRQHLANRYSYSHKEFCDELERILHDIGAKE